MTASTIASARAEIAAQIRAYRDLVGAASKASGMSLTRIDAALAAFEPAFFNNLLVALDARFPGHASGAVGGEVRRLVDALLARGGMLAAEAPLLRLDAGERVALNADDFEALCTAFLAEIEAASAARNG